MPWYVWLIIAVLCSILIGLTAILLMLRRAGKQVSNIWLKNTFGGRDDRTS